MKTIKHIQVILLIAFAFVSFSSLAYSAPVWTSYLPASQASTVYDVALQGDYLWCATANGPVRWDTRDMSFQTFPDAPVINTISVIPDNSGNVWFGAGRKLLKYNNISWETISVKDKITLWYSIYVEKSDITKFGLDNDGNLYIGFEGEWFPEMGFWGNIIYAI